MTEPRHLSPEAWRRINELFHEALEQAPGDRARFLAGVRAEDPDLAAEVESLLAAHERAGSFIERPAVEPGPVDSSVGSGAALPAGQMIGHYRIEAVLGEGGMGVVYLAEDVHLGRTVALKAVAPRFTGDATRRDRLRREARAAAALSHPGIATVYALEEFDGQIFIAGEYVAGETLRDELGRGPLAPARAIETALGVARALAVAHDRGVVHRDLKPENLIRTPGGDVKILDFGLARMRDVPPDLSRLTDDGTLLGTPAYMSPEQIRGEAVDGRADLFALGIVLYELLSGLHPFAGRDPASTIARILEAEPARLSQALSARTNEWQILGELEAIVRTCLRKSPAARYQSAHDLAGALDRLREGGSTLRSPSSPRAGDIAAATPSRWWWQFHQAAVCGAYAALMVAVWIAHRTIGGFSGRVLFLAGLVGALASVTLRLHLWFTLRFNPDDWAEQHAHAIRWTRVADAAFVAALAAGGVAVADIDGTLAAILVGAGVCVLISFTVIEPATTRAALRDRSRT